MRFCTNCGAQLPDGVKFCTECGNKLEVPEQPVRESVMEPVNKPIMEPVSEPVNEPVNEPMAEPEDDLFDEPTRVLVKDPRMKPMKNSVKEPMKERVSEPVSKQVNKPMNESAGSGFYTSPTQPGNSGNYTAQQQAGNSGSYTAPQQQFGSSGSYTAPQQQPGNSGSYTAPQQQFGSSGSYTAPQQQPGNSGSYTAPQQQFGSSGSYTAPQQQFGSSGSYTAPQQQPGNRGSYTPQNQSWTTPPTQSGGGGGYVPPNGAKRAPKEKKPGGNKKIFLFAGIGVAVLLIVGILVAVLLGKGKGKEDPNVGRYEVVSCSFDGMEIDAEGDWIELQENGKGKLRMFGDEFSVKWELDGENLKVEQQSDTFEGILKDGVITVDFMGMMYTFAKDGAQVETSSNPDENEQAKATPEATDTLDPETEKPQATEGDDAEPDNTDTEPTASEASPYEEYWDGKWYGWIIISDAGGAYIDAIDSFSDCVAEIVVNADGTGSLFVSDVEDDSEICQTTVTFSEGSTDAGMMTSGEGAIRIDFPISEGDWSVDPAQTMVSEFDHMVCITDNVYDTDQGWFEYYLFLRPWGMEWEDVRTADTSEMLYTDMMPSNYDDWYLPQIQ